MIVRIYSSPTPVVRVNAFDIDRPFLSIDIGGEVSFDIPGTGAEQVPHIQAWIDAMMLGLSQLQAAIDAAKGTA